LWQVIPVVLVERRWEERGYRFWQADIPPLHPGAHRIEVDEPGLEQRLGHRLQRFAHLAGYFDSFFERIKNSGCC
jgi:hypothetical protein